MSELLDKLSAYGGIDIEAGKRRMMGNEMLYIRCLKMFHAQAVKSQLPELLASGNHEEAHKDAHALKGTTGNLSLDSLFAKYSVIMDKLRANDNDGLDALIDAARKEQQEICDIIQPYL